MSLYMDPANRISVIIPVYNARETIRLCLDAVFRQTRRPDEVIVLDNGSTDGTAAVLRDYEATLVPLPSGRNQSAARNEGAAKARGDVLVFLDADVELAPDAVATALGSLAREEVAAVVGIYDTRTNRRTLIGEYKNVHMAFNQLAAGPLIRWTNTSCLMVRRAAFFDVGGFDLSLRESVCEDLDLGVRLSWRGHRIFLDKNVRLIHHREYTWRGFVLGEYKRSRNITRIFIENVFAGKIIKWPVRLSFKITSLVLLMFYGVLLFSPVRHSLAIPLLLGLLILNLPFLGFLAREGRRGTLFPFFLILLLDASVCLFSTILTLPQEGLGLIFAAKGKAGS